MPRRSPRLAKIEAEYTKNNKKRKWTRKSYVEISDSEEYAPPSSDSEEFEMNNSETDTLTEELAELDAYKCPISNNETDNDSSAEPPLKKRKLNTSHNTAKINSFEPKNTNTNTSKKHWGSHKYSVVTGGGFSSKTKALQTLQFIKGRDIKYQRNMVGAFLCGARSIFKKAKTDEKRGNINDAIDIFSKWMKNYELNKDNIEDFNYLQLNVIKQYEILTDLYNNEKRKNEEFIDEKDNIFDIEKTFLNVFDKLEGEIRGLRVTMNENEISWDIVRNDKLLELKKELIKYDIRCDGKMKTIDECLLYYKRGKLKGLPSRVHLQMIMYGYSPNKASICRLAKDVKKMVKKIEKDYV